MQILIHPIFWIIYSVMFFRFIIKGLDLSPTKTVFCLKCYCILMMPLAIEALIRSLVYVHDLWGYLEAYHVFFLIVSILILCLCIFTLNDRFSSLLTRIIYICIALVLIYMIIIFPRASVMFEASLQIMAVWGCIAISLYGLSRYAVLSKDVPDQEEIVTLKRERILAIIGVVFCLIMLAWISPIAFLAFQEAYFVFLPIIPILFLCLCIFTLNDKYSGFIIRNIYICITITLVLIATTTMIAMSVIFQYTPWIFTVSLQYLAFWVCVTAVPCWLLFYYNIPDNKANLPEKERVLNNMLCFCFRLILCAIVIIFLVTPTLNNPHFEVSFQCMIILVCMAAILYALLRYVNPSKIVVEISEKQRILRYMLRFCIVLAVCVLIFPLYINLNPRVEMSDISKDNQYQNYIINQAISTYHRIHPGWTSEFSPEEAVDITDRIINVETYIRNSLSKYVNTGAISIILKNEKYISQFNVEAWRYSNRGVRPFLWWVYDVSLEDYKKGLAKSRNYNSLSLDSPYDGIGNVFFRENWLIF